MQRTVGLHRQWNFSESCGTARREQKLAYKLCFCCILFSSFSSGPLQSMQVHLFAPLWRDKAVFLLHYQVCITQLHHGTTEGIEDLTTTSSGTTSLSTSSATQHHARLVGLGKKKKTNLFLFQVIKMKKHHHPLLFTFQADFSSAAFNDDEEAEAAELTPTLRHVG